MAEPSSSPRSETASKVVAVPKSITMAGTTLEIDPPLTWSKVFPVCPSRPSSGTAYSSAVRPASVASRQFPSSRSPRNNPTTMLVLPTSMARSIQPFVHAAAAVALEVEGDVPEAERFQLARDPLGQGLPRACRRAVGEDARQVGRRQLDAGDRAVMADADLGEAGRSQHLLGPVDLR